MLASKAIVNEADVVGNCKCCRDCPAVATSLGTQLMCAFGSAAPFLKEAFTALFWLDTVLYICQLGFLHRCKVLYTVFRFV